MRVGAEYFLSLLNLLTGTDITKSAIKITSTISCARNNAPCRAHFTIKLFYFEQTNPTWQLSSIFCLFYNLFSTKLSILNSFIYFAILTPALSGWTPTLRTNRLVYPHISEGWPVRLECLVRTLFYCKACI